MTVHPSRTVGTGSTVGGMLAMDGLGVGVAGGGVAAGRTVGDGVAVCRGVAVAVSLGGTVADGADVGTPTLGGIELVSVGVGDGTTVPVHEAKAMADRTTRAVRRITFL